MEDNMILVNSYSTEGIKRERITNDDLNRAFRRLSHLTNFACFYFTVGSGLYRLSLKISHRVVLTGKTKREIYGKIHAFCDGIETARRLENGENL
jgi:hypothetical protein